MATIKPLFGYVKVLDSMFYESDVAYMGAKCKEKAGMATDKQPFLGILATARENAYPTYLKLCLLPTDTKAYIENFISKRVKLARDRKLNTDG